MKNYRSEDMCRATGGRLSRCSKYDEGENQSTTSMPRLVVSDAILATKVLVAKTRAEVGGLNAFLSSMTRRQVETE